MAGLSYRREIDGLRAIAVLGVVLYHAGIPALAGGYVGVDVFFVISGYLITSLLLREWRQSGRIDLPAFYARRVRRLMPAMWLVMACTLLAAMVLFPPGGSQMQGVLASTLASLVFAANLYFSANSGGYFDAPTAEMPLLHLWSLSVEEQFYLLFPLVLIALLRWWPRRCVAILSVACIASLALAEVWLRIHPAVAFYQMPARFWELAVGGVIAVRAPGSQRWSSKLVALGVLITALAIALPLATHFPGLGALPAVLGAGLVLYGSHSGGPLGVAGAFLSARPMVAMGLISYSLYLWHWPLLAFDRALNIEDSPLSHRLGLCVAAVFIGWASYRFVETPFRRGAVRSPGRVLWMGAAASIVLAAAALFIRPAASSSAAEELAWATQNDQPENVSRCHFKLGDEIAGLRQSACASDPSRVADTVIWGDSHALAWQPFAWELARARGGGAVSFTMDACPPVENYDVDRADYPGHRGQCRRFNALVLEYLSTHRIRTLVINGRWLRHFAGGSCAVDVARNDGCRVAEGFEQSLAIASRSADSVMLMVPTPELRASAPKCIASGQLDRCAATRAEYDQAVAHVRERLLTLAAKHANVIVIDPAEFFCDSTRCPVMKGRYALFWDDDHVSSTAARAFARVYLDDQARWLARSPAQDNAASGSAAGTR
jgi:peptidoglycan/LPS O-acetylase OafA/YrhL